jgi:hypothetical protein
VVRRSIKAALFSGLLFPGIGHIFLKHYRRGVILMVTALGATAVIVDAAVSQALTIVDRINSGEIADQTTAIAELANSSGDTASAVVNIAVIVISVCWLFGIVDACRLGMIQDKKDSR